MPPGTDASDGKMTYWLGTDGQARDMLSAIFYGMRISLFVGAVSVVAALAIGVVVGLVAAYAGGKVDAIADAHRRHPCCPSRPSWWR